MVVAGRYALCTRQARHPMATVNLGPGLTTPLSTVYNTMIDKPPALTAGAGQRKSVPTCYGPSLRGRQLRCGHVVHLQAERRVRLPRRTHLRDGRPRRGGVEGVSQVPAERSRRAPAASPTPRCHPRRSRKNSTGARSARWSGRALPGRTRPGRVKLRCWTASPSRCCTVSRRCRTPDCRVRSTRSIPVASSGTGEPISSTSSAPNPRLRPSSCSRTRTGRVVRADSESSHGGWLAVSAIELIQDRRARRDPAPAKRPAVSPRRSCPCHTRPRVH